MRAPTGVTTNGRLLHERFLYTLSVLVLRKVLSIIMIEEYFFILCLIILMAGKSINFKSCRVATQIFQSIRIVKFLLVTPMIEVKLADIDIMEDFK